MHAVALAPFLLALVWVLVRPVVWYDITEVTKSVLIVLAGFILTAAWEALI